MIYLVSLLVFYIMAAVISAAGRRILLLSRLSLASKSEELSFSYALGFGLVSYLLLFLGIFNLLYNFVVILLLFLLAVFLRKDIIYINKTLVRAVRSITDSWPKPYLLILAFLLVAVGCVVCIGAMAPSYSNDSMVYHLVDAKYFANTHRVGLIPYNSTNSLWPYLVEMYFTLAILLNLLPLAGLFHFSLAVASALGVYAFSKRFFSNKIAVLAATIFFLVPGIFMEATQTYVDLGAVFYALMAVYAFIVWIEKHDTIWVVLSGAMCGFGMSVKYFSVVTTLILGTYFVFMVLRGKGAVRITVFKSLVLFSVSAIAASCIWYVRQYVILGNPIFPFFYRIFGSGGLDPEVLKAISEESIRKALGLDINIKGFLTLPWRLTMFPKQFGGEQLGPIFLAVIPAFVFIRGVDKNIKRISIFTFAYICIWFLQYQHLRFLLPVAPFLSIITAYILCKLTDGRHILDKVVWGTVGLCLAFSVALSVYYNIDATKVVFGLVSRQNYLAKNERSFAISEYINKNLPKDIKVMVVNEGHTFFIDKPHKRELYYWIYSRYDKKHYSPRKVLSFFKSEGFTHILYAENDEIKDKREETLRLTELMKNGRFKARYLRPIHKANPASKNANNITYTIYEIKS